MEKNQIIATFRITFCIEMTMKESSVNVDVKIIAGQCFKLFDKL